MVIPDLPRPYLAIIVFVILDTSGDNATIVVSCRFGHSTTLDHLCFFSSGSLRVISDESFAMKLDCSFLSLQTL